MTEKLNEETEAPVVTGGHDETQQNIVSGHIIQHHLCVGCGNCLEVCPLQCIEELDDGTYQIVRRDCIDCGTCPDYCPTGAIIYNE